MKNKSLRVCLMINASLLGAGLLYAAAFTLARSVGSDIFACRVLERFGVNCPGCGGSRALLALLRLDFLAAFCYSPAVVYGVLLLLWYDVTVALACLTGSEKPLRAFPKWTVLTLPFVFLFVFLIRLFRTLAFGIPPI